MIIAVDFDGTVVKHEFPNIGAPNPGAIETLKELVENGHKIILYTIRSAKTLEDAIKWYSDNEIPLYGVNKNPQQHRFSTSPKVYAKLYIDDAAFGAPLLTDFDEDLNPTSKPYINWNKIRKHLKDNQIIK